MKPLLVRPAPCVSNRCPLAPDAICRGELPWILMFIATLSGGTSAGAMLFAAQACPHIADVEFHVEIDRAIAGRYQRPGTLQRAFMRACGAQVERQLSVIHLQVAVEVLDRPVAEHQFAEGQVHLRIGVLHLFEVQRRLAEHELLLRLLDSFDSFGGWRWRRLAIGRFGFLFLRKEWREVHARRRQLRLDVLPCRSTATNLPAESCPGWPADLSVRCGLSRTEVTAGRDRNFRQRFPQLLQAGRRHFEIHRDLPVARELHAAIWRAPMHRRWSQSAHRT